jgi:hypothetical protein
MNYLAHAIRFLDRPNFVAGTAVPDWLSVVDRQVRMRPKLLEPWIDHADSQRADIAAGIQQHLCDDAWFHATRGFAEVTGELGRLFREAVGSDDGFRCGFLGHIVTEMLIDAVLIDDRPDVLAEYYGVLGRVDPQAVEATVNEISPTPTRRLAAFIRLFHQERILVDYQDSQRLLMRLNQVQRRVKLMPVPESGRHVLDAGRELVRRRLRDLLPPERFPMDRHESPQAALLAANLGSRAGRVIESQHD